MVVKCCLNFNEFILIIPKGKLLPYLYFTNTRLALQEVMTKMVKQAFVWRGMVLIWIFRSIKHFTAVFQFGKPFWSSAVAVWMLSASANLAPGVAHCARMKRETQSVPICEMFAQHCTGAQWQGRGWSSVLQSIIQLSSPSNPRFSSVCLQLHLLTPCSTGSKWGMGINLRYIRVVRSRATRRMKHSSRGRGIKSTFAKLKTSSG